MAPEWNVRVSDAERDAVAAQLREHYAQGRLSLDELNERLDRAFASRTRADLNAVTSDLPYTPPRGVLPSDGIQRAVHGPGRPGLEPPGLERALLERPGSGRLRRRVRVRARALAGRGSSRWCWRCGSASPC